MKYIPLTQGQFAIVDDEDFEQLIRYNWCAIKKGNTLYACRSDVENGGKKNVFLHRAILGITDKKQYVDHKDGNGLNNQRSNIRVCTPAQNSQNKKKDANSLCGFKGVHVHRNKFRAMLRDNGKAIHIGVFNTAESAAKAYDETAKKHFGEFARLNFPKSESSNIEIPPPTLIKNQKRLNAKNSSGFMGVCFKKHANKFCAKIMIKRAAIHLGYFQTAELAAHAYDKAVKQYLGENAPLNFP